MQLGDVDLGNLRITVGGHVRPLDDLTRRAVLDWLDHRRSRWPNTANPHLLITQKTAIRYAVAVLARPRSWPTPGGWDGAVSFGLRSWAAFTSHTGGIEVYDVGWAGWHDEAARLFPRSGRLVPECPEIRFGGGDVGVLGH
ncbi:hypothetical protein [Streptomyces sp. PAM3C]|uniref:hypothetical protein n=1 Tax=Streptomyces sp. PAM3C TaxID=2847300 RepID=UPI001C1E229D|nr:hypothetical protein [Streptomyces sp. PAM3C]MBU5946007.1 hypothetical protein [Streptomyces sp. PAM3C]